MDAFSKTHTSWQKIIDREHRFFTHDLSHSFKSSEIPVDIAVVSLPLLAYNIVVESPDWDKVPDTELPITEDEVNRIWEYVLELALVTCKWIHWKREPVRQKNDGSFVYKHPNYKSDIDITHWANKFRGALQTI